jgi:hypothetical protein
MTPAEAADELRALTALHIANPRRVIALEMSIKRLKEEADLTPPARVGVHFILLSAADRMKVVEDYCVRCWRLRTACACVEKEGSR